MTSVPRHDDGRKPLTGLDLSAGLVLATAGLVLAACGTGGSSDPVTGGGGGTTPQNQSFFLDPHFGGNATSLQIVNVRWGRLVDIFASDSAGVPIFEDFVIGEDITSDALFTSLSAGHFQFDVDTDPITSTETVTVPFAKDTSDFDAAMDLLVANLGPVQPKGLADPPNFSMVPRNAALVIQFNDLINPISVGAQTLQVLTGYPPTQPFEGRILIDENHGGVITVGEQDVFHPTRVIVDMTVTDFEANLTSPPLAVNGVGLPASVNATNTNFAVRIPAQIDLATGQFSLLTNLSGKALDLSSNGPLDLQVPGAAAVVRAMRSGGDTAATGDPFNGFLLDQSSPQLLSSLDLMVEGVTSLGGQAYLVNLEFESALCAQKPEIGDVIELAGEVFLRVIAESNEPVNGLVNNVSVEILNPSLQSIPPQVAGLFRTPFRPSSDLPECFVSISPTPGGPPNQSVAPLSTLSIRFSEPIDPGSVLPFDTFVVNFDPSAENDPLRSRVIGVVIPSTDLREFAWEPRLPLSHTNGSSENYFIDIIGGADGITDLAGNALEDAPPTQASFTIDQDAPTDKTGGVVLTFHDDDPSDDLLDEDGNGSPEIAGEIVPDEVRGVLYPRPLSRFSLSIDRSHPVPSLWTQWVPAFPGAPFNPVTEPFSHMGARVMTLWRHLDMGFDYTDPDSMNMDAERLYWVPSAGVSFETFPEFEIALTTSGRFPDEGVDSMFLPLWPGSGLITTTFDENALVDPDNEVTIVHPREKGYTINSLDTLPGSGSNGNIHPYPWNSDANPDDDTYWTWRDTTIQGVGGPDSGGLPTAVEFLAGVITDVALLGKEQGPGKINTQGLPILMDFRCFPTGATVLSGNTFDISIAAGIAGNTVPIFRVFSAGGLASNGSPIIKDPDLEEIPSGGFDPTVLPPGVPTPPADNMSYSGQADFVIRVSRAYTVYLDTGNTNTTYVEPVIEPDASLQPSGTSITLSFRGADNVSNSFGGAGQPGEDALTLDVYGDVPDLSVAGLEPPETPETDPAVSTGAKKNTGVVFTNGHLWVDSIEEIDGSKFVQTRVTFITNATTGLSPEMSALGIPYRLP